MPLHMATILRAEIPFPEQADGPGKVDVVLPQRSNAALYALLAALPDGGSKTLTSKGGGIDVAVAEIANNPGAAERMTAALRALDMIEVVRRGAELVLVDFEPKRDPDAPETMGDVAAGMRQHARPGDTVVGKATDDTSVIKPGKAAPRGLTEEERARLKGGPTGNNAAEAAAEMSKRLFRRR